MPGRPLRSAIAATLELFASERPELLGFQLEVLLSSSMQRVAENFAADCGAPLRDLDPVIQRASLDLDNLERRRGAWRDPAEILESPNAAALVQLCRARQGRVQGSQRRLKLQHIHRKLEEAREHANRRKWIEGFIGPRAPAKPTSEGN